jgi:hypothetical protein
LAFAQAKSLDFDPGIITTEVARERGGYFVGAMENVT